MTPAATPVFFLAGGTGISAETLGNLMLQQFPSVTFMRRKIPFITSVDRAVEVVAARRRGGRCQDGFPDTPRVLYRR